MFKQLTNLFKDELVKVKTVKELLRLEAESLYLKNKKC